MKITMTGRKVTLRPTFVERTETKLSKLDKFFDTDAAADVTVTAERDLHRVEVTIRCSGMVFRAEEAAEDMNEAVDRLVDILLRQIRKNKTRLEKRLRSGAFVDSIEPEERRLRPARTESGRITKRNQAAAAGIYRPRLFCAERPLRSRADTDGSAWERKE